jgi:putative inorganic carbon (HCO3(-)) transporter
MAIKKNDFLYLLLCLIFAATAAVAIGNPDTSVGLYTFVGLTGIIMVMAIVIKPSLGASILIIAIFTNISSLLTVRGYPGVIKPLVVVVFAAIMVRNYYAGQLPEHRTKTQRIEFFLILYLAVVVTSYLVAANTDRAMTAIQDLAKDIAIIYTVLFALRKPSDWKQAIWVIILTTAFVSLFGLFQVFTNNYAQNFFGLASSKVDGSNMRLGGPINDPNMWGQVVVAVIPLIIFRIIHEPQRIIKLIGMGLLVILLMELFNTYSRGAYLALAVIVFLILFVFEKNFNFMLALASVGLIILILPFLPANYIDRFASLTALSPSAENGIYQDSSFRGRTSEILTGFSIFSRNPFLGVGVGNFPNNYQKYSQEIGIELRSEEREAHSLYLQVMAETGIFGIFAFLGIVISLLAGLSKTVKSIQYLPHYQRWLPWINALQVSILGYLVAAVFLHGAYIRYFWILVALSITAIQLT